MLHQSRTLHSVDARGWVIQNTVLELVGMPESVKDATSLVYRVKGLVGLTPIPKLLVFSTPIPKVVLF